MSNPKPVGLWWRNTYFLFGVILFFIGLIGLFRGPKAITDPGQPPAAGILPWLYLGAAALFIVNGFLSHGLHVHDVQKEESNDA